MLSVITIDGTLILTGHIMLPDMSVVGTVTPHLLYMALIAGLMAVLCWNIGNKIITPTNGVLFMDVVPVTAFIVSALIGIVPSSVQLAGAGITATALILNNLNQRKQAHENRR